MIVKFIAHAGISIKTKQTQVLIDPWFTDSSLESPCINSITGRHTSVDFQIPKSNEALDAYNPDAILISHFHAHHSSRIDIEYFCKRANRTFFLFHPPLWEGESLERITPLPHIKTTIPPLLKPIQIYDIQIMALPHTVRGHLGWVVTHEDKSVVHIADARINKDMTSRELDTVWSSLESIENIEILFLGAGENNFRGSIEGRKIIYEATVCSPTEAARIVEIAKPKRTSLIGCYNHSIWQGRNEYTHPAPLIEDEFRWAVSWLSPQIQCVFMRPGDTLQL